jgi:hypothetical protein
MRRKGLGFSAFVVASGLALGCGNRGGEGQTTGLVAGIATGSNKGGLGGGSNSQLQTIGLPQGYEQPRGIVKNGGTLYVSARESATQKAVILSIGSSGSQVLVTGDVLGTPNVMTDPVALALGQDQTTLYVADLSSVFSADSVGAVLVVKNGQVSVLSAGSIDAPSGIAVQKDGSLAVCGSDPVTGNGAVFSVAADTGTATLVASGGALTQPTGLGITANGTIFVTDAGLRLPSAQLLSIGSSVAALVTPIADTCGTESGVAARGQTVYFAARNAGAGKVSSIQSGSNTEQSLVEGSPLVMPQGVCTDGGSVYVADQDAGGPGEIFVLN